MVLLQTRQYFTLHLSIVCIFTPIERNPCIYLEFLSEIFSVGGREKLSMIVTLRWGNVTAGLPSSLKCCVPENTASEQIAVFYNFFHLKKFFLNITLFRKSLALAKTKNGNCAIMHACFQTMLRNFSMKNIQEMRGNFITARSPTTA